MRRRTFLDAVGAAGVSLGVGARSVGAHPTPTDDEGTATPAGTPRGDDVLGRLDLPAARETVVGPDGHTAYVAIKTGMAVVAIEDPTEPRLLATRTDLLADSDAGPMQMVQDLAVDGDRLLVAGPANPAKGATGYVLFDVSDRANPERVAGREVDSTIHNCDFDGRYAYLTANGREGNPLLVADTKTDDVVGTWSLFDVDDAWRDVSPGVRTLHDVVVHDGRAYLAHWDAGTWILDVGDPSSPALLATVRGRDPGRLADVEEPGVESRIPPGNDHYATVNEDATLLGIGMETFAIRDGERGGPSGIDLYDITDPTATEKVATIPPPPSDDATRNGVLTTAHNFELVGGRCYSSWYNGGVKVHDVTDPAAPAELFAWRDSDATSFWTAQRAAGCVVATNTNALGGSDVQPALYTFPDVALPQNATATPAETGAGGGDDGAGPPLSGAGGPGFGVVAALGGIGLWAWRQAHRQGE